MEPTGKREGGRGRQAIIYTAHPTIQIINGRQRVAEWKLLQLQLQQQQQQQRHRQ